MDLPQIGAHCSLLTCHALDLLPIRCNCDKLFCRQHVARDQHDCASTISREIPMEPWAKSERCFKNSCTKPTLASANASPSEAATCPRCHKAFCASHRHTDTHSCSVSEIPHPNKNEAAQKLLAKHFPSANGVASSSARTTKALKDPKKRAQSQKIEMMKMRHNAVPGDPKDNATSVTIDQRLHVKVILEDSDYPNKDASFWFRKNIGTGKALDNLAIHLGIPASDSTRRQLARVNIDQPEELQVLRNDQTLSDQVEDGSILKLFRI